MAESQTEISMSELSFVPPTVNDHTEREDGMTLHTIDSDPDTDIEIYDDNRDMHMAGNPPSDS
jgi:hypothetical protein